MNPEINKEYFSLILRTQQHSVNAPKYHGNPTMNSQIQNASTTARRQPTQAVNVELRTTLPPLGPRPVFLTCPICKSMIVTRVEEESTFMSYVCCTVLCLIGCCICSCVPFLMSIFKDYYHSCPRCNALIGIYRS